MASALTESVAALNVEETATNSPAVVTGGDGSPTETTATPVIVSGEGAGEVTADLEMVPALSVSVAALKVEGAVANSPAVVASGDGSAASCTVTPGMVSIEVDEEHMRHAVSRAHHGIENKHGGPFGACIVHDGKVVASGHNTVLRDSDPSAHAEMNAIRAACKAQESHVLEGCTLYTTAEPCPMCMAASYWARIERVVIGAPRELAAEFGFDDAFFYEELSKPHVERSIDHSLGVIPHEVREVFEKWQKGAGVIY
jgi:guanine deaminase